MKNFSHNRSPLKQKLQNNELSLGSWLTIPHQSVVEILGTAGFEWLTLDIEHAAIGIEGVINMIGHIQGNGMQALVRVSKNEEVVIKRVLDAGADGIIVPTVRNKEEAAQAVSFAKYPPVGTRGVGLNRAQKYGTAFDTYQEWVKNEIVVIAQIEHIDSVNNLEEILSVPGIDGIIIGPYDLSASMGYPGEYDRDDVKEALARIDEITKKMGKPLGFHVIDSNHEKTLEKVSKGYSFLAFSLDFFFLGDKAREEMKALKSKL
ncbi:2,4-dihydroxyhept-2-ene-1,7-dioic acid aldolase [Flavobacterium akiainvivens]|uniref:2,4-dihydroxyhept-2-ene-1,7-dioic acid aldolase n=1 Tax=Flavobacterium akiainvivens TaxID=1202724 RepID=A0A0M8MHJ9_9FLAO|nr:aldolase/citrate lyase family protein [Flavobacterium akiainvivens]KOS06371.1 2,4-dihydroxyhept-2-ene-1,7-dioic acid aldolase [Flavobacterium akiainvivens]SFQ14958.1 2-dehydro-3-deoxyglucarate aldolase [Flavobacterium akiainvivens]